MSDDAHTTLVDLAGLPGWLAANGLRLHSNGFGEIGSGEFVGIVCPLPPAAPLAGLIGLESSLQEWQDETLVRRVVSALLRAGRNVATGCTAGRIEQAVIEAVLDAGQAQRLIVFAAFGPHEQGGEDWQDLVAVDAVRRAFDAGACVHWWAGTPRALSMHAKARLPLDKRLADCGSALLHALAAEKGSGLVVFAPEPGPWPPTITVAARQSMPTPIPVVVFGPHPLPLMDGAGGWARAGEDGVWKLGWKWTS